MSHRGDYLFGYGSLVSGAGGFSRQRSPDGYITDLRGFRRCWGVAMDNSETIPGYKVYRDPEGGRPPVFVAFLDLQPDRAGRVNGVCIPVRAEDLRGTDLRERNYVRKDVTASIDDPLGRVWAYLGSAPGRRRLARGKKLRRVAISREYLDEVESGFRALGPDEDTIFGESTGPDGFPVRELFRVDLPE